MTRSESNSLQVQKIQSQADSDHHSANQQWPWCLNQHNITTSEVTTAILTREICFNRARGHVASNSIGDVTPEKLHSAQAMGSAEISYLSHFAPMNQPTPGLLDGIWSFRSSTLKSLQKYQEVREGIMQNDCILGSTLGPVSINVVMKKFPSLPKPKFWRKILDALRHHHHLVVHM